MSAEELSVVPPQNALNSQLAYQDDPLRFSCGPPLRRLGGDPSSKIPTRELTGFIDEKIFSSSSHSAVAASNRFFSPHSAAADFPRNLYRENHNWNCNGNGSSGDESDDDDGDFDDDDDDADAGNGDRDVETLAAVDNTSISNGKSNINTAAGTDTGTGNTGNMDELGNGKLKQPSGFGSSGEVMTLKDGAGSSIGQMPDGDTSYFQYLQATEGSGSGGKDTGLDNSCGFSGRMEGSSFSSESGESLRTILSDPITGALMDDAMILPCGHSFGAAGIQHIIRMKACHTCSQSVTEDSIAPNLSLRAAVQAFRREEELQFYRVSKRRRERFDQDKVGFGDSNAIDIPRGRGVQFPFSVADRVIIMGNKRTPQRFVGREAVVTTQCLNGWYVVKTLDNAESVKLQYRSLAKVKDDASSKIAPNWL